MSTAFTTLTHLSRHQWIFITDTVDAVYHPDSWTPEAMFDRLADKVVNLPIPDVKVRAATSPAVLLALSRYIGAFEDEQ